MSDDPAANKDQPPSDEIQFPEAPPVDADAARSADPAAGEEVEYVYQDEHGNPIAAPDGGFDPNEFEVVAEEEAAAEAAPDGAGASAPPEESPAAPSAEDVELAGATTQKLDRPVSSSRRLSDRKSGRQPKPMTPEELKKVRRRVILVLGLLSMIPILGIALIFMLWKKGHIKLGSKKPNVRMVDNAYEASVKIVEVTGERYERADKLYHEGKMAESKREYQECLREFNDALGKLETFLKEHPDESYNQVETLARRIRMYRGQVQARLVMLEKY